MSGFATVTKTTFAGHDGSELAARLDLPAGPVRGYALFAHCFTCSKDIAAARHISGCLARSGIAVLRFDFTGLGRSGGDFANTNFSSNVADLVKAADHLREVFEAPSILIGHSLGGAAVLAAAHAIPEAKAVVTIGAPSDVSHVLHNFGASVDAINTNGEADVSLGGRSFRIRKQFVDDAVEARLIDRVKTLGKALLVMHAPRDETVGIENATGIFVAAKHPKSFVSLDDADHLLNGPGDAQFAATVIAGWSSRYVKSDAALPPEKAESVNVSETGLGKFQAAVSVGPHRLIADEPKTVGGLETGPSPYEYLSTALGACTTMTLRMYADHKKLELPKVSVSVSHGKVAAAHCEDCGAAADGRSGKIDRFERVISVDGPVSDEVRDKLIEIADKCPVHKTLHAGAAVVTRIA
ncbi:MAG: bifunctional alpha/beta hydrolase/OsmC family protein [Pseudomonadota bacterium]